jgi:hypothetical protein
MHPPSSARERSPERLLGTDPLSLLALSGTQAQGTPLAVPATRIRCQVPLCPAVGANRPLPTAQTSSAGRYSARRALIRGGPRDISVQAHPVRGAHPRNPLGTGAQWHSRQGDQGARGLRPPRPPPRRGRSRKPAWLLGWRGGHTRWPMRSPMQHGAVARYRAKVIQLHSTGAGMRTAPSRRAVAGGRRSPAVARRDSKGSDPLLSCHRWLRNASRGGPVSRGSPRLALCDGRSGAF